MSDNLKFSKQKHIKKKKEKKKKPRSKLLSVEIEGLSKEYIKARDLHTCQMCNKVVSGRNEAWSHVIPKGRSKYLRWHPLNTKVLCLSCHRFWHDNPTQSAAWFNDKFPGRYDMLVRLNNKGIGKFGVSELEEIRDWYIRSIECLPEILPVPGVFEE